jgi:hypothetical protein
MKNRRALSAPPTEGSLNPNLASAKAAAWKVPSPFPSAVLRRCERQHAPHDVLAVAGISF